MHTAWRGLTDFPSPLMSIQIGTEEDARNFIFLLVDGLMHFNFVRL